MSSYELQKHIEITHTKTLEKCSYCDFRTDDKGELKTHVITKHEDSAIITIIGNQQIMLNDAFGIYRQDMEVLLNRVIQGQNFLKSELMLIKEELSGENVTIKQTDKNNLKKLDKEVHQKEEAKANNKEQQKNIPESGNVMNKENEKEEILENVEVLEREKKQRKQLNLKITTRKMLSIMKKSPLIKQLKMLSGLVHL